MRIINTAAKNETNLFLGYAINEANIPMMVTVVSHLIITCAMIEISLCMYNTTFWSAIIPRQIYFKGFLNIDIDTLLFLFRGLLLFGTATYLISQVYLKWILPKCHDFMSVNLNNILYHLFHIGGLVALLMAKSYLNVLSEAAKLYSEEKFILIYTIHYSIAIIGFVILGCYCASIFKLATTRKSLYTFKSVLFYMLLGTFGCFCYYFGGNFAEIRLNNVPNKLGLVTNINGEGEAVMLGKKDAKRVYMTVESKEIYQCWWPSGCSHRCIKVKA